MTFSNGQANDQSVPPWKLKPARVPKWDPGFLLSAGVLAGVRKKSWGAFEHPSQVFSYIS
jgi:hypothetical protein